jgi:hypothetical protein
LIDIKSSKIELYLFVIIATWKPVEFSESCEKSIIDRKMLLCFTISFQNSLTCLHQWYLLLDSAFIGVSAVASSCHFMLYTLIEIIEKHSRSNSLYSLIVAFINHRTQLSTVLLAIFISCQFSAKYIHMIHCVEYSGILLSFW